MPLQAGVVLEGRYRVEGLLGHGGMGAVYRAWDERLRMAVALKENALAGPDARAQFEREALVLARLHHSNLPKVIDHFVTAEGSQYLVMTFVEGLDLAQLLATRGRQSPAEVSGWLDQVCDALTYLHSQNPPIIHRDIKPQNIKITPDGHVFLVDFGLSKVGSTYQSTASGALGVTPGFSPLEQYGSAHTDPRSDVYSLAATLYAMLTGETPPESVSRAVGTVALKPPRTFDPNFSPALERALLHGLEMQPTGRPATVAALRQEIEAGLGPPGVVTPFPGPQPAAATQAVPQPVPRPVPASPPRQRGLSGWVLVGVGALAVVVLVMGLAALGGGGSSTEGTGTAGATDVPATRTRVVATGTPIPPTNTPVVATSTSGPATNTPTAVLITSIPAAVETRVRERDGAVMVYVPAGEFTMGSAVNDSQALSNEKPQHTVTLPAFWIDRTEVTNAQYRKFVEAGGYDQRDYWTDAGWAWKLWNKVTQPRCWDDGMFNQAEQPVVCVSWYEADAYAHWAGGRLPSEAEWEKAACGIDERIYPWGNQEPSKAMLDLGGVIQRTRSVGSYPTGSSPYGALDMAGNVWEWTGSVYQPYPYNPDDGREDREIPSNAPRVLRGGSRGNPTEQIRCAFRTYVVPWNRYNYYGFRIVSAGL